MNIGKKIFFGFSILIVSRFFAGCTASSQSSSSPDSYDISAISDSISRIISNQPGEIGVALIINDTDTVTLNNQSIYPMMSVFKMHQALAVCDMFDSRGLSLDSVVSITRASLNPDTWSPMLKEHPEDTINLSIKQLMRYTLILSDNNASNYLFDSIVPVSATDSVIAKIIPRSDFRISYTEEDMFQDHAKAYSNYTSPLGAASLINRLFTDSIVSSEKQSFITTTLGECLTGQDRIVAPLLDKEGVSIAHKTGSGYINERGELVAHNDVAFIRLREGIHYSLAVLIKDYPGTEAEASGVMADVSAVVYSLIARQ